MTFTLYNASEKQIFPKQKTFHVSYAERVSDLTLKVDLAKMDIPPDTEVDVRITFTPRLLYAIELLEVNIGKFDQRTMQYLKGYLGDRPEISLAFRILKKVAQPPIAISFVIMIFEQYSLRKVLYCDGGYIEG